MGQAKQRGTTSQQAIHRNQMEQTQAVYEQQLAELHSAFRHIEFLRKTIAWKTDDILFMYRSAIQFFIEFTMFYHKEEIYV